ncbi:hypothetical protein CAC42_8171 [Sphaceloma murrayae]|uniref:Uncharacterized protein n=1 Tax=Sphaceloma murrayae TaxID=2082308 RepID=A0A2K1QJU6_9PEZI|nr:hypothetical protein CAC42_8171 [Sphaceloma murrayae]
MVAKVASSTYISIFAALAICLSAGVLGCAGNILHTYNAQKTGNPWWLPLWPQHFDDRGLKALIGGGTSVIVLDAICMASLFKTHKWQKDAIFVSAFLAAIAAGVAVIYPAVLNQQSPMRDTMQSWTCKWSSTTDSVSAGVPSNFPSLCMQNRLAFYAGVPILVLQMTVLGVAMFSMKKQSPQVEAMRSKTSYELTGYEASVSTGDVEKNGAQVRVESRSS